ncbi:hypothetical protein M514_01877 [Trichuris suis]|uniref:SHSP domain-containing protein n=1 Tax=Trichuris suis TaxID=68888 RepID=A0A085MJH0_9BILA|nr:hypothetical protein M513_01877 [Trichuris suis]KFD72755.1 hypothetical protein M514_01877 [Trichuris suis]KHJ46314.1 hypothetical protein D918_03364 [Trichuris suis]
MHLMPTSAPGQVGASATGQKINNYPDGKAHFLSSVGKAPTPPISLGCPPTKAAIHTPTVLRRQRPVQRKINRGALPDRIAMKKSCQDDETATGAPTKKTNDDGCKAPSRKESVTAQFNAIDNPTVYTRRGLIRGERTLEALKVMHSLASINCSYGVAAPPAADHPIDQCYNASSSAPNSPLIGSRRRLHPVVFGQGGFNDRSSTLWEWPLGTASVLNTDDDFEVELYFSPFSAKEITAKVMGNELLIHCKSDAVLSANDPHPREIFRSYQMPLNVDPKTVRFSIKEERYLRVKAKKERPLKLALAYDTNNDKWTN